MSRVKTPWMWTLLLAVTLSTIGVVVSAASDGRWKLGGDGTCVWDETDSGPDQCSPNPTGRWKLGGDGTCYWDAADSGPDQCSAAPAEAASLQSSQISSEQAGTKVDTASETDAGISPAAPTDPPSARR